MAHRIKKVRLLRLSDAAELEGFIYDQTEGEYEVLVAQEQLLILFFDKSTYVEKSGGYLLYLPKEDL